jgi:hypothetical protein
MMARSTIRSNQRPDTLMQDRKADRSTKPLATRGRTIHLGHFRRIARVPDWSGLPQRRVGDWRAGLDRSSCSLLPRPFVCECHTISTMPRFQPPPRRTQSILRLVFFVIIRSVYQTKQALFQLSHWSQNRGPFHSALNRNTLFGISPSRS